MSTRSQIRFVHGDTVAQIYRHSDGYPDTVVSDLRTLKEVQDETGSGRDPSYTAANFIFLMKLRGMRMYTEDRGHRESLDESDLLGLANGDFSGLMKLESPHFMLGYGVEDVGPIHGDEEYLYIVDMSPPFRTEEQQESAEAFVDRLDDAFGNRPDPPESYAEAAKVKLDAIRETDDRTDAGMIRDAFEQTIGAPEGGWEISVSEHGGFPRWDEADGNEFDEAVWQFVGTLDDAHERFVEG